VSERSPVKTLGRFAKMAFRGKPKESYVRSKG
jgi:hypothetical protein